MTEPVKVMIDTNVLVSAIPNPAGIPYAAYAKASVSPYALILCDQILEELRRIFNLKFQAKIPAMERFLSIARYDLITVPTLEILPLEKNIRDVNDRPILRAALKAGVQIFITGDKDFLESGIQIPHILTPAQFLRTDS